MRLIGGMGLRRSAEIVVRSEGVMGGPFRAAFEASDGRPPAVYGSIVSRQFDPFNVGQRFRVIPSALHAGSGSRIDLIIGSGAFGSGEHETTASCLEVMETMSQLRGARVLDLGSGTGILAIAALKLGARSAFCVDNDPAAVRTAERNCELNGIDRRVQHLCGTIDRLTVQCFDVILANIYGDVLLAAAEALVSRARPGGSLLLSGIVHEVNFDVVRRYEAQGCVVLRNRILEEFTTVLLSRASS
jgi:ribosomal protein L11 methyltransferase